MSVDRFLKPERLDVDPSSPTSSEQWKHWLATIAGSCTYEDAIQSLKSIFEKTVNEIYARHLLAIGKQLQDCKAVTVVQYQEELVSDAFVRGVRSQTIRQRLLESRSVDLASIYELASVLDAALRSSENYNESHSLPETVAAAANDENNDCLSESPGVVTAARNPRCFFCGRSKHPRFQCPAREATCNKCGKKGHFAKECRSSVSSSTSASLSTITSATLASVGSIFPHSLAKAVFKILLCGKEINCLIDSGSSESFIHPEVIKRLGLKTIPSSEPISMASSALSIKALGCITVELKVQDRLYKSFRLRVLPHLCADVILGQDFHRMHENVTLNYGGSQPPLIICGLATLRVDPPRLSAHLTPDCRPIATTSRKFSAEDTNFIRNEVWALLEDGVIEPSISPWRAEVRGVLKDERRKKRLAVDYSATINSPIDLKSAYHQIPIPNDEKLYTAFEADESLYQFTRIPFGVTNGVACFQRVINSFIEKEKLKGVVAYLDDPRDGTLPSTPTNVRSRLRNCASLGMKKKMEIYDLTLSAYSRCETLYHLMRKLSGEPLIDTKTFPVSSDAKAAFEEIETDIENSAVRAVDENLPFELETDASDVAIAAVLNQLGRPVAFFSRTLQGPEKRYAAVKKESQATIEAIRHWKHYLTRRHFPI
ncbi:Retrovirus-related Pol polyprotein from transposon 17.6 [Trichinella britovi]|uniref:Retrovirus-related Pol polyprotein from transposon 17.6 n=1 Tax=Trichinella britovi TaxID=45882 RepID=A0A0V1CA60_TRIBR|nr:Retrovirus-related Pol polyprotein from transposon 17.6 [Trichinella britovi]